MTSLDYKNRTKKFLRSCCLHSVLMKLDQSFAGKATSSILKVYSHLQKNVQYIMKYEGEIVFLNVI